MLFKGQLPLTELDIDTLDEMLQLHEPLNYDLAVQLVSREILIRGQLRLVLDCQCVRCLRAFKHEVVLSGPLLNLALDGDEAVAVVNDCVDLTPFLREDILLAFPQHPVCGPDCPGIPPGAAKSVFKTRKNNEATKGSTPWAELNKLKF